MKNKILKIVSILLFLLSIIILFKYIIDELLDNIVIDISSKIIIILIFSISIYLSSLLYNISTKNKNKEKVIRINNLIIFCTYLYFLIIVVFFDSMLGRNIDNSLYFNSNNIKLYLETSFNIIPFKTIVSYIYKMVNGSINILTFLKNLVGNLVLLMPFSIFIMILNSKKETNLKKFSIIIIISILIEILQFLTFSGNFDIDDVILNVFGAFIAFKVLMLPRINKLVLDIANQSFLNKNN